VTRHERIRFLLEHLEDVRAGVRDGSGKDAIHIPLMCRAWNSVSFQELERLLPLLRAEQPRLASHLSRTFFAPRRRMLTCPRCNGTVEVWASANFHRHGHKNIALVPRVLRIIPLDVSAQLVDEAIAWLDERWQGAVFIPDELLGLVAGVCGTPS
jgi:hypothetical protein